MYYDDPPEGGGCANGLVIGLIGIALIGLLFYFLVNRTTSSIAEQAEQLNPFSAQPTKISVNPGVVVQSIRTVNRLETTSFVGDRFIEAGQQGGTIYNLFLGDKLLLIANGEVTAGFDLSKLTEQNIQLLDSRTITLTLPPAQILSSKLNNERTRVYERQTGLATRGDAGLESEARRIAEQEIVRSACESDLLVRANVDGQRNMESLLKGLGFTQITVRTQTGPCTLADGQPLPPAP